MTPEQHKELIRLASSLPRLATRIECLPVTNEASRVKQMK